MQETRTRRGFCPYEVSIYQKRKVWIYIGRNSTLFCRTGSHITFGLLGSGARRRCSAWCVSDIGARTQLFRSELARSPISTETLRIRIRGRQALCPCSSILYFLCPRTVLAQNPVCFLVIGLYVPHQCLYQQYESQLKARGIFRSIWKAVKPPYGPRIDGPVTRTFLILVTLLSEVTRTSSFYRIWYIALIRPLGSFYAVVVGPRSLSHLICPIARVQCSHMTYQEVYHVQQHVLVKFQPGNRVQIRSTGFDAYLSAIIQG